MIFFMLIHYRLPGVVASFALLYYAIIVLALFRLIPVTLTLAGIAGFVLSVGMAVDANILIFERTKEELRVGQVAAAGDRGGLRPRLELDPRLERVEPDHGDDPVLFGSSVIQGFALVLIIGVLASMFTAIIVTRSILRVIVAREWARKAWLYGVSEDGVHGPPDDPRRPSPRGARCLTSSASAAGSSSSRRSSRSRG